MFSKLEAKININFTDKKLLVRSLTHKSLNHIDNNEKLEFLGDRVLGLVISKILLELFPNDKEGVLDKKLSSLVNKKKCCEIGKKINLHDYIMTGNFKKSKNILEDKIIADACEALIGAIYLDQGLNVVEDFINKFWKKNFVLSLKEQKDSKTKLQEYSLKKFKTLPKYKLLSNSGPHHKPIFKVSVNIQNLKSANATGASKKDAQQKAATLLLKKIGL